MHSYEVTGRNADDIKAEVNAALECIHAIMENVHVAETRQHVRLQFDVEGTRKEQHQVLHALKQSSLPSRVSFLWARCSRNDAVGPGHSFRKGECLRQ